MKLPLPKGILLVGEPGCGKSETAKAVSSILKKPLLRLNMGSLLGQYVGQSENNFIEALRTAEAAQPCILWIDEIEKAFSGAGKGPGSNDNVMTRIIGLFLTWMQEHKGLVYLVATANDLSLMKDEFLRKGRWDEIFYLSKPDEKGRNEIVRKTLNRYKLQLCNDDSSIIPENDDKILLLAKLMDDMSGADIASVIINSVQEVYGDRKKRFEYPHLPLSVLEKNTRTIKEQKEKSEKERIELHVKSDLLEMKIQDRVDKLEKEDIIVSHLRKRYTPKSKEEKESEYKAMGYISAAKLT
jgi:SpoVK/Ycf46/Vps4 family AAA+-type ATPase